MKIFTKIIKIVLLAFALSVTVFSVANAGSDVDLGVTVSCSGYNCTATSKFNGDTIDYQKNGAKIGPFPKAGEVRLYFQILSGASGSMAGSIQVKLTKGATIKTITIQDTEEIIDTTLSVNQGDYVYVKTTDVGDGLAVGWHAPHSGDRCGSGFTLPRTGGVRTGYYPIVNVSNEIAWAREAGEPIVQDMCWADWPEWVGDYDFEDYFMAFSYVPEVIVFPTVDLKVNGSDSTIYLQEPADYTLTWTSQNANTCSASNAWSGSKALSGSQAVNDKPQGTYTYTITCWNGSQSATDTVQVVVQSSIYTYLSVSKLARNISQNSSFLNSVNANQGDMVEFSIDVYTNGSGNAPATYVKDILPGYLDFIEGSVKVDGYTSPDTLLSSGLYLGDLYQGSHKQIKFSAYVMSGLPVGTNVLTNSSRAWASSISEVSDTAEVVVTIQGTNPTATISSQKTVRDTNDLNTPSGIYLEDVNTVPGRVLEFSIVVTGTGGTASTDVMVHDTLPAGLTYIAGSTTVDGSVAGDGIIAGGINIGTLNPGQSKTVKFRSTVRENTYFTSFVTKLINTVTVKGSNNTLAATDTANIWVSKSGRVLGATDIDTGVDMSMLSALLASSFGALGFSGFQVGKKAYWRGKIAQLRKAA